MEAALMRHLIRNTALLILLTICAFARADKPHDQVVKIVRQIQHADYADDRAALKQLYAELAPFVDNKEISSRVLYWRGFALWRRAINGFNDSVDAKEQEADLNQAIKEFNDAISKDPNFVDAKVGAASCMGYLMFMARDNQARIQELMTQSTPLLKSAMEAEPDNPRLLWVLGPIRWTTPPERGGGQQKAFDTYQRGLQSIHGGKYVSKDPLDPSWGEPELLMNLAWSYLNCDKPNFDLAQQNADAALALVPYWHYVRDILLVQIKNQRPTTTQKGT
jgi:tetratricopeptide (TPR) repeat protein